jgi:MYXO-CTERM domain-containing protein
MRKVSVLVAFGAMGIAGMAHGQIWNETVNGGADAGTLPGSSQSVNGSGSLTAITGGWLNGQDIDMYAIQITNAAAFVAEVTASTGHTDNQLYLFNSAGVGIAFDDDSGAVLNARISNDHTINIGSPPDTVGQSNLITNAGNGLYYLAITDFDTDALNLVGGTQLANGIWHDGTPFAGPFQPDGPGAGNATLAAWGLAAVSATIGTYTITLTGASYVPAPGAMALLGLAGLVGSRRRRA